MTTAIRFPAKKILVHVRALLEKISYWWSPRVRILRSPQCLVSLSYLVSCSRRFWCFAVFCRTERTHIWRALCWIPFHSFLQSSEAKFGILKKRNKNKTCVCVCVLLSTGYFSCQSQQDLTVKKIRVGDAKHGQIHFINHNLLVCLRLATAITTFICFELVEKASFKLQLKSAVRESPLDFCTFLKVFQSYYRWLLFSRQTKTYTVPLVCSSFSRKKTYVTFNFHWEISLVV